jgi:hypothetical protein
MGHTSTAHTGKYINHVQKPQIEAVKGIEF